jgi:hypothetical protein
VAPRKVAEVIRQHVTLEVERIDRIYLNVYQPNLQTDSGVAAFFRFHRGYPIASSALMKPISDDLIRGLEAYAKQHDVPMIPLKEATQGRRCRRASAAVCASGMKRQNARPAAAELVSIGVLLRERWTQKSCGIV